MFCLYNTSVVSVRSELTIPNKPNCLPSLHGRTCVLRPLTRPSSRQSLGGLPHTSPRLVCLSFLFYFIYLSLLGTGSCLHSPGRSPTPDSPASASFHRDSRCPAITPGFALGSLCHLCRCPMATVAGRKTPVVPRFGIECPRPLCECCCFLPFMQFWPRVPVVPGQQCCICGEAATQQPRVLVHGVHISGSA